MAQFTLRPKVDTIHSDDWSPNAVRSDPAKDWWEHIFGSDDSLYIWTPADTKTHSAATFAAFSDDDIPSVSSTDGKFTNITVYARGKAIGSGTYQLEAFLYPYTGTPLDIVEGDGYVTHSHVYTAYDDWSDLYDMEIGGRVKSKLVNYRGYRYLDYVYCEVNYTPGAPDVYTQTIVALDEGELASLYAKARRYTWVKEWGFEVRLKSTGELVKKVTWTGKRLERVSWTTELGLADGLEWATTYEGRGYCVTDDDTGYGAWVEFTTRACPYEVTTQAASSVGIDHAKGNGTTVAGEADITERGFEVKLAFSGTLREALNRSIAGFEGDFTYNTGTGKWEGTLVKTVSETGSFSEGAYVDDLGRFPIAVATDKLFAEETYNYRARATIEGTEYYGDWVEFTTAGYPTGEGPDDVIDPSVPIVEPIPPDDEPFEWPDIIYPPWKWPEIDIPPFEFDPNIVFGKTFGAFLRGLDTRKDWITLRDKCIIYQENMNEFVLTVNHNSLVLKNLVIDVITYIDGDVYPSDLELVESSQQLTPLYLEGISPSGFKDIINDFRLKDVCNVHILNLNFKKILNSLNSLYESDYVSEPIPYNTIEYIDIQPTAKRMILQLEDMRKKYKEVRRLTIRNMKRIFTYV